MGKKGKNISREELINLLKEYGSLREVAKAISVNRARLSRLCKEYNIPKPKSWAELKESNKMEVTTYEELQDLVNEVAPVVNQPIYITGDKVITSDWHTPCISVKWFKIMMDKSKEHNVRELIIAGDFFNFDILSYYWQEKPNLRSIILQRELDVGMYILNIIETWFTKIYWIGSNHDWRFMNAMKWGVDYSSILDLLKRGANTGKYVLTELPYLYLDDIRITHPRAYGNVKLSVANTLSSKFRCPVLQAHGHFFSIGYSTGNYVIGDTGGLMDVDRIEYMWKGDTRHSAWNNGFFIYKDKKLLPFAERIGI